MHARPSPEPDWPQILRQAAAGDEGAWRQLVSGYARRVYGLIYRQCGDRELAEEITQDTFVKLVEKLGEASGYQEQGRFEPWLFRIAMNKLRDEMRRRGRHARPMDMGPGGTTEPGGGAWAAAETAGIRQGPHQPPGPLEAASQAERIQRVQALVATLGPADREILELRHTAGLSFAQIAETLGQPLGTVLARGHRALKKLRAGLSILDDETFSEETRQATPTRRASAP